MADRVTQATMTGVEGTGAESAGMAEAGMPRGTMAGGRMEMAQIPLGQVATIRSVGGPMVIKTEQAFSTAWVFVDVSDSDPGSYVRAARDMVSETVELPPGYTVQWSGQCQYMQRAKEKLQVVVPATLRQAVIEGAALRVRPIVMTVTAIVGGLLPIFWGHGAGATVMRRIGAPMVGGMLSATVLTLLVIPATYSPWQEAVLRAEERGRELGRGLEASELAIPSGVA